MEKGNKGIVNKFGGLKINDGCIVIPEESSETILKVLQEYGAVSENV